MAKERLADEDIGRVIKSTANIEDFAKVDVNVLKGVKKGDPANYSMNEFGEVAVKNDEGALAKVGEHALNALKEVGKAVVATGKAVKKGVDKLGEKIEEHKEKKHQKEMEELKRDVAKVIEVVKEMDNE